MYLTNVELIAPPGSVVGLAPIIAFDEISALAGLDVDQTSNGFVLAVTKDDEPLQWWKIRAKESGETTDNVTKIIPTGDTDRIWIRIG